VQRESVNLSILNIFINKRKKEEQDSYAYDQIRKVFRHCMKGLTEEEALEFDPELLGFSHEELIESELTYIEAKRSKQASEIGINLKELRKRFYERIGFENSITIKYHLDRFISSEELKTINERLKNAMPDMFPNGLTENQIRAMYVWGRQKFATDEDIEKSKGLLNLDYKIKKIGRG
jgi:uncharacterized protein (DUF2267 family)